MKNSTKICILVLFGIACLIAMLFVPPIVQDPAFHNFADGREIASIKNFGNVCSNIPFQILGTAGLWMSVNSRPNDAGKTSGLNCVVFFTGIILTGIGSAYYHLNPNNSTLIWDRLPMTIAFMSFFSLLVEKLINENFGKKMLLPSLIIGILSIVYWYLNNDLRWYALVQFIPMAATPLILIMFPAGKIKTYFWMMAGVYAAAKLCEATDHEIYNSLTVISGHTLKHFFAAMSPLILMVAIRRKVL